MQENNSQTFFNLLWTNKNQKSFDYKFRSKSVLGLGISFDGDNYKNWKKLLYGLENFSESTKFIKNNVEMTSHNFLKEIKLSCPRALDVNFDSLLCSDIYEYLFSLNFISQKADHPLLISSSDTIWKTLPVYKKVMIQVLCSLDVTKKVNFVFLEKTTFPEQHLSFISETLKHIASKYDITIVIIGQNKSLPQMSWLPLLPAPLERHHFSAMPEDEEDYDEVAG